MSVMITCKEFARQSSLRQDQDLPFASRVKWGLHYLLCRACARYEKQLGILRGLAQTVAPGFDDAAFDESEKLSEQSKRKILKRIGY
jgi:hypothetical protein